VGGDFNLQTGNIQVSGGVGPLDVVYNVTNAKAKVAAMAPTTAVGILLALNNAINAVASSTFTGEIVGGYQKPLVLMDGTEVMNPCQ
jgi:hypothetical protein